MTMGREHPPTDAHDDARDDEKTLHDLGQAGSVIQHAITYLMEKNIDELSIASALLGGGLGVLSNVLDNDAIEKILTNAIASVRAGDLHGPIAEAKVPEKKG
jgi:hypothetical protein